MIELRTVVPCIHSAIGKSTIKRIEDFCKVVIEEKYTVGFNNSPDGDVTEMNIIFNVEQEAAETITAFFYSHRDIPIEGFEDVNFRYFDIITDNSESHHINALDKCLQEQLDIQSHIIEDLVSERDYLEGRVEQLESMMKKSGMEHYKETIDCLINVIQQTSDINLDSIKEAIFPKVH